MAFETRGLRMQDNAQNPGTAANSAQRQKAEQLMRRYAQRQISLRNLDLAKNPNQMAKAMEIANDMQRCGSELAKIRNEVRETDSNLAAEIESHPAYKLHVEKLNAESARGISNWALPPEPWEGAYYPETW